MYRVTGSGSKYRYGSIIPRGPASAYAIYLQDHYRRLRKHFYPRTTDQQRIMTYCYSVWKQEPQEIKDRYAAYAKFDKERARRDKLEWLKLVETGDTPFIPLRRNEPKPSGYPRSTKNGFMFFAAETRPAIRRQNPGILACEAMQEVSKRWRNMTDDAKKRYKEMAAADKSRYKQQKIMFREVERTRRRLLRIQKARLRLNRLFNQKVPSASPAADEYIEVAESAKVEL